MSHRRAVAAPAQTPGRWSSRLLLLLPLLVAGVLLGAWLPAAAQNRLVGAAPPPPGGAPLTSAQQVELLSGAVTSAFFGRPTVQSGTAASAAQAESSPPVAGPNVIVNNIAFDDLAPPVNFSQLETSIAAFPAAPVATNIVVGYNDSVGPTNFSGYSFSTDGGLTFTQGTVLSSAGEPRGDPAVTVDPLGRFYYGFLDFGTRSIALDRSTGITVARSTDGGATFPESISFFFQGGNARCDLLDRDYIDHLSGNRVVLTFTWFVNFFRGTTSGCTGPRTAQIVAVVLDVETNAVVAGPIVVSGGPAQGSTPRVDVSGNVFIAWQELSAGACADNCIRLQKFSPGLASIAGPVNVAVSITTPGTVGASCGVPNTIVLNGNIRMNSFPSIAVDRSGGPFGGSVYLAWSEAEVVTARSDIRVARCTNDLAVCPEAGLPVTPQDVGLADGRDQFFPGLTVNPNGRVGAIWYDRRLDPNNSLMDLFHADSVDGGVTWRANERVSTGSFPPVVNIDPNVAGCTMGDYYAVTSDTRNFYAAWSDTRNGNPDVFSAVLHLGVRIRGGLEFGAVAVNPVGGEPAFEDVGVDVFNAGDQNVVVNSVTCVAGACTDFAVLPVPSTPLGLAPGAASTFTIRFNPTLPGPRSATIRFSTSDPDLPVVDRSATGIGGVPDIQTIPPKRLNLGRVRINRNGPCKTVSVLNTGTSNLEFHAQITNNPKDWFASCGQAASVIVSPGAQARISVRCRPRTGDFQERANLTLTSNDPDTPTKTVELICQLGDG